jgi:hypothetical protein
MGANRVVVPNVSLQLPLKRLPCRLPLKQAFCAETSNAEKAVAVPPKQLSAKPMLVISAALPSQVAKRIPTENG